MKNKKLPNIYANPISKKLSNVQEMYYGRGSEREINTKQDVLKEIDAIFSSRNFVYKSKVEIVTVDGTKLVTVVGKTTNSLLTMEGESIPISSILSIEKK